jgi:hypothetical protein
VTAGERLPDSGRQQIVAEIRELAASRGRPPGAWLFQRATGRRRSDWYAKYWSRWSDALSEAGLMANEPRRRLDDDAMLTDFAELARSLGRIPVYSDLVICRRNGGNVPGHVAFIGHFGSKRELLARLKAWAEARPDAADIAAMIPEIERVPLRKTRTTGAVYLLQSGKRFKIGCSRVLERRVRSIQALVPDSSLAHSIETDDPRGIEAYWHRRFAAKRLKGEWFELSDDDVAAFRKWRVQ